MVWGSGFGVWGLELTEGRLRAEYKTCERSLSNCSGAGAGSNLQTRFPPDWWSSAGVPGNMDRIVSYLKEGLRWIPLTESARIPKGPSTQ